MNVTSVNALRTNSQINYTGRNNQPRGENPPDKVRKNPPKGSGAVTLTQDYINGVKMGLALLGMGLTITGGPIGCGGGGGCGPVTSATVAGVTSPVEEAALVQRIMLDIYTNLGIVPTKERVNSLYMSSENEVYVPKKGDIIYKKETYSGLEVADSLSLVTDGGTAVYKRDAKDLVTGDVYNNRTVTVEPYTSDDGREGFIVTDLNSPNGESHIILPYTDPNDARVRAEDIIVHKDGTRNTFAHLLKTNKPNTYISAPTYNHEEGTEHVVDMRQAI